MNLPSKDDDSDAVRRQPTAIEAELAQELDHLPKMEQLRTTQDIEGKNILAAAEPNKLVRLGLDALERRIQEKLRITNEASLVALLQNPFAKDRQLRLKMLRAENFDSERALKRLINFLAMLKELLADSNNHGDELRPLELNKDFVSAERDRQNLGALQLLLFRDQAGRRVAGCFDVETPSLFRVGNSESSLLKEAFYLLQKASEDETTQKEGLVFVFNILSASSSIVTGSLTSILGRLFQNGPLRIAAVHVCSPNTPEMNNASAAVIRQLDRRDRIKARFHHGTSWEYTKSLKQFGVPTDWLPTTQADGTVRNNYHKQWLAIQEAKEGPNFDSIECPYSLDILLGRGQILQFHKGNISLREEYIRDRYPQYVAARNKQQKDAVLNQILDDLAAKKRRFLKQKEDNVGLWYEISRSEARSKLVTSFREHKRAMERKPTPFPT
ncbi:hypothetical protein IV203_027738 [Nitzschia inconspicua]|uniref:DUF6824 domain-containing protein n=1 Tax=Nitzschia inconspicua TaxID=303405 RepID=A0A9K3LX83_9STRA|nr:hypothetical protein IV203_027738 [Nitzschia inconspicua]